MIPKSGYRFSEKIMLKQYWEEIMTTRAFNLMTAVALFAACILPATARAAEVKVFTSVALKSVLDELAPAYEKASGNKVTVTFGLAADMKKRVLAGETADVIMLTRAMMEDLQKQNKLAGGLVNVAGTPVAVAARAGAPKPDIGTVEALKKTLLAAKSIVYADPAKGGLSGVAFAHALDRLGIAEQMKAKTILVPGAQAADLVAKGEAELGVGQASEIVPVAGAQLVGPLPGELGSVTLFTAAVGAGSGSPDAAKSLIDFLTAPQSAPRFRVKGFQPG
jgi:molybdate transport system substrate-binding protein